MIPYNPSSFDTNKTLLENILELKKWLQAHPCYEVFYSSASGDTTQSTTYNLSTIADSTNLATGDVVIFDNSTLAVVLSVDTDLGIFTCDTAESFKGPQGIQGPQGPAGADGQNGQDGQNGTNGVSITNVSIDSSVHLICTLSDGNTIDAGALYERILTANSSSGTLTASNLALVGKPNVVWQTANLISPIYHAVLHLVEGYGSSTTFQYAGVINLSGTLYHIEIDVDGTTGVWSRTQTQIGGGSVEGTDVLSTGQTSGKVLTAQGDGTSAWNTISGGDHIVTLSGLSGTLTNDEYNTLLNENSIIDFYSSPNHKIYVKKQETSTEMRFDYVDQYDYIARYIINKGTKAYSHSYFKLTYTGISSGTATSGQVLTADGNGNATWQTAGGGGSSVYVHYITFYRTTSSSSFRRLYCTITLINNDSTAITSNTSLRSAIISIGNNSNIAVGGRMETGANTNIYMPVSFLSNISGTLYLAGIKSDGTTENYSDVYSAITNVTDFVVTL